MTSTRAANKEERSTTAEAPSEVPTIDLGSSIGDVDWAPVPPTQVIASYEMMEKALKSTVLDSHAPVPPAQIAAAAERHTESYKKIKTKHKLETIDDDDDAPRPGGHVAGAFYGKDASLRCKSAAVPLSSRAQPSGGHGPPRSQGHQDHGPPLSPRSHQTHQPLRSPRNLQTRATDGLPPESAVSLPFEHSNDVGPRPSIELEAQLVQNVQNATLIPGDDEVVHGVPVQHVPWWRKRQTFVFGTIGLIVGVGVAVAIVLTVGSKDTSTIKTEVEFVPMTSHPSMSSVPSISPSMFPTFQLSALELVNEVLSNITIPLADHSASGPLGLDVDFTEISCRDLGLQDVQLYHRIQNSTVQHVGVKASGVQLLCSERWDAKWLHVFKASGTARMTLEPTSSMETDIDFISRDFDKYPPHDVGFGDNCITDFDVDIDIEDDGTGLIAAVIETLLGLVKGNLEKNAKEYFCGILKMTDNNTGLFDDMLTVVSDTIETLLGGDMPEDVDPLVPKDDEDPIDLEQDIAQDLLASDLDQLMVQILGSSSFVPPEPGGENEGDRGFAVALSSNNTNEASKFIDNFGVSVYVTSISIDWPDSFKEMEINDTIEKDTLRISTELEYLPAVVGMELAMQPRVDSPLYFQETFAVKANITHADIEFALFLQTNAQAVGNDTLGPIFYHANNQPCISSTVDEILLKVLSVKVSNITALTYKGFLDPGLEHIISTAGDAMFYMYKQSLVKATPGYHGSTLQLMMDDYLKKSFNTSEACSASDDHRVFPKVASAAYSHRMVFGNSLLLVLIFSGMM